MTDTPTEATRENVPHLPDCAWWSWDWSYTWHDSDCTCTDVGAAPTEAPEQGPITITIGIDMAKDSDRPALVFYENGETAAILTDDQARVVSDYLEQIAVPLRARIAELEKPAEAPGLEAIREERDHLRMSRQRIAKERDSMGAEVDRLTEQVDTTEYMQAIKDATGELEEMISPTITWQKNAAQIINKHLRPLFLRRVVVANERDQLRTELEASRERVAAAVEVYAGMDGFKPETAPEAYCLRILKEMCAALKESTRG